MVRHGDYEAADFSMLRLLLREKGSCWSGGRGQCLVRDEDEDRDEEVGINPRHSFLLLFNGVVGRCWSRSGSPPDQNCFLFFFLGTLPWINVDTPLFSAHNLNFARRPGPMRNGCPAHFQCSPERTGAPSPTMHAPSSRTCSPPRPRPPMMGHQTQGWAPFPGRHSLDRQAWLRPGSGILTPSRCLALRPGLFHFSQERAIFPGQPFPCPPSGVQASASLVFSALSPDPNLPHRRCSPVPVFAVSLLPPPSSSSTKLESLGCASLSFFREHSSNKSCAIFHFVRSFIRPPPINRDRQQQLDRRQTVDTTSSTSTKLLFFQHPTHTHARFVLLFARLLRRTSSPRPDDTHPRVANLLPSSDPVSVSVDGPPQHRTPTFRQGPTSPTPSSSSFLLLDIQFFHLLSPKKCPLNRRGILAIICVIGWSRWIRSLKHRRTGAGASVSHPNAYTVGVCRVIFWLFLLLGPSRATCPKLPNLGFMVRGTKCWVNLKPGEEGNQYLHLVGLQAHSSKGGLTRFLDRYHSNFSLTRCALSDLSSSSQLANLYGCQPPIVDDTPHPRSTIPQQSESQ